MKNKIFTRITAILVCFVMLSISFCYPASAEVFTQVNDENRGYTLYSVSEDYCGEYISVNQTLTQSNQTKIIKYSTDNSARTCYLSNSGKSIKMYGYCSAYTTSRFHQGCDSWDVSGEVYTLSVSNKFFKKNYYANYVAGGDDYLGDGNYKAIFQAQTNEDYYICTTPDNDKAYITLHIAPNADEHFSTSGGTWHCYEDMKYPLNYCGEYVASKYYYNSEQAAALYKALCIINLQDSSFKYNSVGEAILEFKDKMGLGWDLVSAFVPMGVLLSLGITCADHLTEDIINIIYSPELCNICNFIQNLTVSEAIDLKCEFELCSCDYKSAGNNTLCFTADNGILLDEIQNINYPGSMRYSVSSYDLNYLYGEAYEVGYWE